MTTAQPDLSPEHIDPAFIIQYIRDTFAGVNITSAAGDTFFIYDPERNLPPERQMPFATLVTSDTYDKVSNLNRDGIFRLNIGISKATFLSMLGAQPARPGEGGVIETGHDFAALDQIMPHPVYGHMFWVCVLNPSEATFKTLQTLLAEAYAMAAAKIR